MTVIDNGENDLILIMTPEKQDKTLELSKHWSVDSTPARNEVIINRTYPVKSVQYKFSFIRETKSGNQQCGLHMKALIKGLGTRLECRHTFLVITVKTLWKYTLGKNSMAAQWTQTSYP